MANTIAALVVKLGLDAAEFVSGLSKAEYESKKFADQAAANFKKLAGVIAGLGIGALVKDFIESTISSAAALNRMATATGAAVEELSRFGKVAKLTGTASIEDIGAALQRLVRSMQGADEQSKGAGAAFAALGIKTRDAAGNLRDSGVVLEEVARALNKYGDGANKTAIAQALLGRSGAQMLPFLKQIAQDQTTVGKVTTEQAEAAEKLEKEWRKLTSAGSVLGTMILNDLVPPVSRLLELVNKFGTVTGLQAFLRISDEDVANPFKALDETSAKLVKLRADFAALDPSNKGITYKINEVLFGDAADLSRQIAIAEARETALRQMVNEHYVSREGPKPQAPPIPKVDGGAMREAKQAIADYANEIQKLKDALDPLTQEYPKLTAAQEKIMADMQAGKAILWDTADAYLRASRALDEQAISAKAAAEAQKILDEEMKQAEAIEKRATDAIGAYAEQLDAFEKGIGVIGKGAKAYDLLNAEIEHNKRLKLATADTVDIENAQYERQKNLIGAYHEANEVLQQQIELNRIFEDSFSDALVSVVEGTKSVSQAFKDMARSITHELNQIAARNIAKAILGENSAGGGGLGALIQKGVPLLLSLFSGPSPDYGSYATGPGAPQLGGPGGNANGTDFWRGGPTWVGERGPEIVNLPRGSQVIPSDQSRRMAGTTNVYNINVMPGASSASVRQTGDMLRDVTMRSMRSR